jgi:cold shock CspA family protein
MGTVSAPIFPLHFPMRLSGNLRTWNDERGFGFITPLQGQADIFVHVSAFPRDGSRPTVGERLSYELGRGRDGKPQAVNVIRAAIGAAPTRAPARARQAKSGKPFSLTGTVLLLVLAIAAGTWGYRKFSAHQQRPAPAMEASPRQAQPPASTPAPSTAPPAPTGSYRCDGRTHCSQMTSCAEATWFLRNCPGTKMDGNNDGVPCEQQWCTAPWSK